MLLISLHLHQDGHFYPKTGKASEVGKGPGAGYSVNIPWPSDHMGSEEYAAAFQHVVLPVLSEFDPQLILVSAGFDAAEGETIANMHIMPQGYR